PFRPRSAHLRLSRPRHPGRRPRLRGAAGHRSRVLPLAGHADRSGSVPCGGARRSRAAAAGVRCATARVDRRDPAAAVVVPRPPGRAQADDTAGGVGGVSSRRDFVATGTAALASLALGHDLAAEQLPRASERGRTRLILLGTAGGPTPKLNRAAPAQAIV